MLFVSVLSSSSAVYREAVSHGCALHKHLPGFPLWFLSCWIHRPSGPGRRTRLRHRQQTGQNQRRSAPLHYSQLILLQLILQQEKKTWGIQSSYICDKTFSSQGSLIFFSWVNLKCQLYRGRNGGLPFPFRSICQVTYLTERFRVNLSPSWNCWQFLMKLWRRNFPLWTSPCLSLLLTTSSSLYPSATPPHSLLYIHSMSNSVHRSVSEPA